MPKFDDLLLETIEHVLKRVFGEPATKFILGYLVLESELKENPEAFEAALRKVLGDSEVVSIENLILGDLCSKIGLSFERKPEYRFSDYIRALKRKYDDLMEEEGWKKRIRVI